MEWRRHAGVVCLLRYCECVLSSFIGKIMQLPRGIPLTTAPEHSPAISTALLVC